MLDVQIFGLNPVGHHASSLMLHLVNTLLVFGVLLAMTRERVRPVLAWQVLFREHLARYRRAEPQAAGGAWTGVWLVPDGEDGGGGNQGD